MAGRRSEGKKVKEKKSSLEFGCSRSHPGWSVRVIRVNHRQKNCARGVDHSVIACGDASPTLKGVFFTLAA
jgi:hypothetical protein